MPFETKMGNIKIITNVSILHGNGQGNRILMVQYDSDQSTDSNAWSIPAPELNYGEHPEERVALVLESLGLEGEPPKLEGIESLETNAGWQLILHYVVKTHKDIVIGNGIRNYKWFSLEELPPIEAMALGKWERNVAANHLRLAN